MFDIPAAITSVSTLVTGILNRVLRDPNEEQKRPWRSSILGTIIQPINGALQ